MAGRLPKWVTFKPTLTAINANVLKLATGLLTIAALLLIFDCCQNIGVGILRGLGDVSS